MNPPEHSDYMLNMSPKHRSHLVSNRQMPLKFVGMSGVQTTRSLNTPNSNALVSGFKARHNEESFKKSTESKIETLRSQIFNPEGQSDISENGSVRSLNPKKTASETDQPRFQFKPRDRLMKKSQSLKIDSINNALELYILKKQASKQTSSNPSLHMYTKPPSQYHPTHYTSYEQTNSSQEYGIQIQKPIHFKKVNEERAESNSKPRPRCLTHGNKSPCLDDFVLGKRLGKGKFGEVFLVKHKRIGLVCAMKVLSKDTIKENKFQSQLSREVIIQLYFNHPNVVQMYGMFTENNNFYLLLEPCLDGHLLHELKRKRRFGEEEGAEIIREVLEGVDLMHRSDVIHRDLKPENIVRHEGVSKISDFGWAVHSPDNLRETFCGTPLYMSPELLIGKQYTQSVDIWAVGMLAYQILIGRLPFKVQKSEELTKIITDQIQFPQHVGLSQNAKDFVTTILKKNPLQRCDLETLFYHPFLNKLRQS